MFCYFIELWMVFVFLVMILVALYIFIFVYKQQDVSDILGNKHSKISKAGFRLDNESEVCREHMDAC